MGAIDPGMEAMLDTFIHETDTMLEQLDEILMESERAKNISDENINSIFRITHTIKSSAAMMGFGNMSSLAHSVEDVFYILREDPAKLSLIFDTIFDLVFQTSDYLKNELCSVSNPDYVEGNPDFLISQFAQQAEMLKGSPAPAPAAESASPESAPAPQTASEPAASAAPAPAAPIAPIVAGEDEIRIRVFFEDDCQMENMRAYMLLTQLQHCCAELSSMPPHPENDGGLCGEIIKNGFVIICKPIRGSEEIISVIESALNIKTYEILGDESAEKKEEETQKDEAPTGGTAPVAPAADASNHMTGAKQSLISVKQSKLDQLMDLVGEIVTTESMVSRNPDLEGLKLDNFQKSIRELRKLTNELQDILMSVRMVPLYSTFHKMERIVRDMSKKLDRPAELITIGGDTEVDKTINDAVVDPFMHMIRNSMDHAIEPREERLRLGKPEVGKITLSARNAGGEILIDVSDDGCGLDAQKLLKKAKKNGILTKPENEYTEREAFNLIMLPGFSTNTAVTEYSGRGVGMDVVRRNIEQVGGTISIASTLGEGTTFTIKFPLTLAIVDGMNLSVGDTVLTVPITSIKQSFKVSDPTQILRNTNNSEMILIRGECYPIIRLHEAFGISTQVTDITKGILLQVESGGVGACIFADELLGEYQVVVKPFPNFFTKYNLKELGLSGCSILGNGMISLIVDINSLLKN